MHSFINIITCNYFGWRLQHILGSFTNRDRWECFFLFFGGWLLTIYNVKWIYEAISSQLASCPVNTSTVVPYLFFLSLLASFTTILSLMNKITVKQIKWPFNARRKDLSILAHYFFLIFLVKFPKLWYTFFSGFLLYFDPKFSKT